MTGFAKHRFPRSLTSLRDSLIWAVRDATGKHGVPPASLRIKVHGSLDVPSFLAVGEACAQSLLSALAAMGVDPHRIGTVLDFGCGVGRTLSAMKRYLPTAQFSATDIDAAAVTWCKENIQPASYAVNESLPPLPFDSAQFDLIYAVSVFSHLDEEMQFRWLEELHRVARPGAALLLSVHGPSTEHILPAAERPLYHERGFWFTRADIWADYFPDFYHTAIHTRDYVEKHWSKYFSVVAYTEKGMAHNQDLVVLRKTDSPRPAPAANSQVSFSSPGDSGGATPPFASPEHSIPERELRPPDDDSGIWAAPRLISDLRHCKFYHTMDIPSYGHVEGQWDLRGDVDGYLGHQDYRDKRVLELGSASGFLTFELEKRGASVVGFDLRQGEDWDVVPFGSADLSKEGRVFAHYLDLMKNGFWLAHAAHGSRARVVYGNIYDIPRAIGEFDIALFGSILLHLRDPFGALAKMAPLVRERIVITEPTWFAAPPVLSSLQDALNDAPDAARRLSRADAPAVDQLLAHLAAAVQTRLPLLYFLPDSRAAVKHFDSWWHLSPRVLVEFLQVLGFERTQTTEHTQLFFGKAVPMWTVVGERAGARRVSVRGGTAAATESATPPAAPSAAAAPQPQSAPTERDPLVPPTT